MYSFGGCGGKVIIVINLNDCGFGFFCEVCEIGGVCIIVFNVLGIIKLEFFIIVWVLYVIIVGQIVLGDGVCIVGEFFWVNMYDVVVCYMCFCCGEIKVWYCDDFFGGNLIGNIMIDYCFCIWGLDENIFFYCYMYDFSEG